MDPFEVGASPKQRLVVVGAKEPSQRREIQFALALRKARVQLAWRSELDPKADSARHSKSHLAEQIISSNAESERVLLLRRIEISCK